MPSELPDLDAVVLLHAGQQQLLMGVPIQIEDFGSVAHVAVEIVRIVLLFLLGDVPNVHVSAVPARGKHTGVERTPLHLHHAVLLSVESNERSGQVSHIPDRDILISRPTDKQKLVKRREVQGVDLVSMRNYLKQRLFILISRRASKSHVPDIDEPVI